MMNLDKIKEQKDNIRAKMAAALRDSDDKALDESMGELMQLVSDTVMAEAKGMIDTTDKAILAARGVRQLTSTETKFYEKLMESVRMEGDPQTVITNIGEALPMTTIDTVIEDMQAAYPLLGFIDFVNTGAAIKWVLNAKGAQSAEWGDLNSAITKSLEGEIQIVELTQCKLSAFMYTTQDMLQLGPVWVDRLVRATLAESISVGLENGIVDGNGLKMPIGMTRDFTEDFSQSTGYPRKDALEVTKLDPASYGSLLSSLTTDGNNGRKRPVPRVILIVNPTDYFTKIMPVTTLLTPNGQYVNNILPFPTDIVQSVAVPDGHAVLGIAKKYFMSIGTGDSKGGKLLYSDEYKWLEDLRTYKIKFHGMGRPYDINAFAYLDISGLGSVYPTFDVNSTDVTPENP